MPRAKSTINPRRFNFEVPEIEWNLVQTFPLRTGITNMTENMRRAIRLYHFMLLQQEKGIEVCIRKNGRVQVIQPLEDPFNIK